MVTVATSRNENAARTDCLLSATIIAAMGMDMVFRDDECRIRSAHAPANFATIKHMASNLLRRGKGKHSMRASRHIAGWDEDFLYSLLTRERPE